MNVVFDFGAVLFGWQPQALVASAFPDRAANPEQAAALAKAMFGHADWLSFDRGTLSMQAVIDQTASRLDLEHATVATLVQNIGEQLAPIEGTLDILTRLSRRRAQGDDSLRLFYLSNMSVPFARALERNHDFLSWFEGGIFSGDVHLVKPEPEIFALLESRYALEPCNTVFIDDVAGNVAAARTRGWQGIHFESPTQLHAQLMPLLCSNG